MIYGNALLIALLAPLSQYLLWLAFCALMACMLPIKHAERIIVAAGMFRPNTFIRLRRIDGK
ncbi:hypothetical protein M2272_005177 [Mycobacterium frederiksbergense]|uniref:Uncharacterized protein n=1 Tax=Mycolicibacterium frederiksbergense TaxID=117567 RepID=A0ABT6L6D8_9MYCO|nr:hypothetical protein [Mycolicibacterium frederiksbergense]